MNDSLFNTSFEMSLRLVLLLASAPKKKISLDGLLGIDFISCYASEFDLPYENLHGINDYKYGEIVNRRILVQEAVINLVTDGLVEVSVENGFIYSVSNAGRVFAETLKSDYAKKYRTITKEAIDKYIEKSDEEILLMIQDASVRAIKGE